MRRPSLALLWAMLVLLTTGSHATAQEGGIAARAIDAPLQEARLLRLTNEARAAEGLPPYVVNEVLQRVARRHAAEIGRHDHFSHVGLDGRSARQRITDAGYGEGHGALRTGENYVARVSAAEAFAWLSTDPPHARNLLHERFREIGIGAAPTSWGGWVWVMDFGYHDGLADLPVLAAPETATPLPGRDAPRPARPSPTTRTAAPPADTTAAPPPTPLAVASRAPVTPLGPPAPAPTPLPGSQGNPGLPTLPTLPADETWGRQLARAVVLLLLGAFLLRAFLMSD